METSPNTFLLAFEDGNVFQLTRNSTLVQSYGLSNEVGLSIVQNRNASIIFMSCSMVILQNSVIRGNVNSKYLIKFSDSLPLVDGMVMMDNRIMNYYSPLWIYYKAVDNQYYELFYTSVILLRNCQLMNNTSWGLGGALSM